MKRLYVALAVILVGSGIVGNVDVADEYERGAVEKEVRPARVMSMPDRETWWTLLHPSGTPATLIDCGDWARLTINHNPCYSNQPCGLRRVCYGDASRWVQL